MTQKSNIHGYIIYPGRDKYGEREDEKKSLNVWRKKTDEYLALFVRESHGSVCLC